MKKALKIIGITLLSLLGVVVLAVSVACYVVFTPKRLTPIVSNVADSLLVCDHSLEEVNLTFWRTFPDFGVSVKGLYVINRIDEAETDTVLAVPELVAAVDILKAIDGDIIIKTLRLKDAEAYAFINSQGVQNFDVLRLNDDTEEDSDTTSSWQLKSVRLDEEVNISLKKVAFVSSLDSISAALRDLQLTLSQSEKNYRLALSAPAVSCSVGETQWADSLSLNALLPVEVKDDEYKKIGLSDARLSVNEFEVNLSGEVSSVSEWTDMQLDCDLALTTNRWHISSLLALLPEQYKNLIPKEVEADGDISLEAKAVGRYDSVTLPVVEADIHLTDAAGHYDMKVLPYHFDKVEADIYARYDNARKAETKAEIKRMYVHTGKSAVALKGTVTEVLKNSETVELAKPLCVLAADAELYLPDAEPFLQTENGRSAVKGKAKVKLNMQSRLDDITALNLSAVKSSGSIDVSGLDLVYADSTLAVADRLSLTFNTPRRKALSRSLLTADVSLKASSLKAQLLSQDIDADIKDADISAAVELNTKDSTAVPFIKAQLSAANVVASMDTISADIDGLAGSATIVPQKNDGKLPMVSATLSAGKIKAAMGDSVNVSTGSVEVQADALYKRGAKNFLLQWNPRLKFNLKQAHADVSKVGMPVDIPAIRFSYNNSYFRIDTSRIVIGNSDFSLAGDIRHLGKWLKDEGELTGNLRFVSDHTDVNELLALVNRLNADTTATEPAETAQTAKPESVQSDPFMVPLKVDLQMLTLIRSADVFNQNLRNLGGMVYIKDGKLILEEMGFVSKAAKLQLTAMYRTPRRNHIYVGLDYHMVDIDLQQLISMIPQLDTLVPMLKSFEGRAQFHVAAETYVNDRYDIKPSTLRGACSIEGKDLVMLDNETFDKISKILMFKRKTVNKFDSLSAQIVAYKDQITVYPFCLSIDNYMAALGGTHNLDMTFDYHVSLLRPLYLGVDVGGTLDDLKIKPAKCRYAQDFRPIFHKDTETRASELRQMVATSLKKDLKIKSDDETPAEK